MLNSFVFSCSETLLLSVEGEHPPPAPLAAKRGDEGFRLLSSRTSLDLASAGITPTNTLMNPLRLTLPVGPR